ncbi:MAG: ectoine synthase [Comamonas sp.]|nr:ectoine synthase [Comamonas sp.]
MLIRHLDQARQSGRMISAQTWDSTRLLLKDDQMGFSFHITRLFANTETVMHYQNHLESVYIISGEGELENRDTGEVHPLAPGTLYVLDKHDRHTVRTKTEITCACVFNPPLNGTEVHDASGAYPLDAPGLGESRADASNA